MNTRILLADDHKLMREGLRALLEKDPDIEVIGESVDGHAAVALAREFRPDIVVMDITMPNLNGIEATRQITVNFPEVRVIGLSMHFDRHFVMRMIRAGAKGYLRKDCASEELIEAIRVVKGNKLYISPHLGFPVSKIVFNSSELSSFIASSILTDRKSVV